MLGVVKLAEQDTTLFVVKKTKTSTQPHEEILNVKRIKKSDTIKDYVGKLMAIVNQNRLLCKRIC